MNMKSGYSANSLYDEIKFAIDEYTADAFEEILDDERQDAYDRGYTAVYNDGRNEK